MADNNPIDFSYFPYSSYSDIRIKNDEHLTYANINSHMLKLYANLEALGVTNTLQKATYNQWGTVKKATTEDIISVDGNRETVLTNEIMNKALVELKHANEESYFNKGELNISKNYKFTSGEFVVGANENIAKRITTHPELVVFSKIDIAPYGYENRPFHTTRVDKTDVNAFDNHTVSSGMINFADWNVPKNYREFHVYYHKSGYVICRNSKINEDQEQLKINWTLMVRV